MKVWREEVEEHAEMNEEGAGSKVERRRLADAGSRKGISSEESTERVVLTALFPRPRFARENPSAVLIFVLAMLSIFLHGLLFRLLSGEDRCLRHRSIGMSCLRQRVLFTPQHPFNFVSRGCRDTLGWSCSMGPELIIH